LKFKNPPIVELICGIQFQSDRYDFTIVHDFFNRIKSEYPNIEENPPLTFQFDSNSGMMYNYKDNYPLVRYFFINKEKDKLIQLQNGRFLFNWRKDVTTQNIYPNFINVFREFEKNWNILYKICSDDDSIKINQLELTYIDHIAWLENTNIKRIEDAFIFIKQTGLLSDIDTGNILLSAPINELKGHLFMNVKTARLSKDKRDILVLETTTKGITNEVNQTIKDWFNYAHLKISEEFMKQTTEIAKKEWGIINT
jgi:uncharacterized protein (TIGR04255 family)